MHLDPYRFRSSVVILHHVLFSFPFWANCMRGNEKKLCIIEMPCPIARRRPGGTGGKKEMVDKDYMVGIDFTAITSPEGYVAPTKTQTRKSWTRQMEIHLHLHTQLLVLKPQDQGLNLACNSCVTIFLYSSTSPINLVTLPSAQTQS